MFVVKSVCSGMAASNVFLMGDGERAVIIDAGAHKKEIFNMVKDSGMTPELIILTHCHFDHIEFLNEVRDKYSIPAAIHKNDADAVLDKQRNGAFLFASFKKIHPVEKKLEDSDTLKIGKIEYKIIHTPGHTSGGICIFAEGVMFTGDTLFAGSVGRTDLGDGSYSSLITSIKGKILTYADDTILYPGHGPNTTIEKEKKYNPFLS